MANGWTITCAFEAVTLTFCSSIHVIIKNSRWNDQGLHNVNCWYNTMTVIMSKLEALLNDLKEVALGSFEEQVSWLEEIDFCKELSMFRCSMLRRTVKVKQHHKWKFTLWLRWMEHAGHIDYWLWFQSSKAEDLLVSLFVITNHSQKCFANFTTSGIMCVIILYLKQHLNLIWFIKLEKKPFH